MRRLCLILFLIAATAMCASATWRFADITRSDMIWPVSTPNPNDGPFASCVAWGDLNDDGAPDLFVGSSHGANCKLYMNSGGGRFDDRTNHWNLQILENVRSAQFIDYDQDGLLDLFCITDNSVPVELYRQSENHRMSPVSLNIDETDVSGVTSAVWNDLNHDGRLDLILNGLGGLNPAITAIVQSGTSFIPARDGEFPEGINDVSRISMIDFDCDGDLDILAGSSRNHSQLLVNNGGRYADRLAEYGIAPNAAAKGIVWADFNRDSYLDFVTCGTNQETYMYMGGRVGGAIHFREVLHNQIEIFPNAPTTWLPYIQDATSVHAGDYNMDGWIDLFFVRSNGNLMLLNNGDGLWTIDSEVMDILNPHSSETQAVAWADIDGDGDLDFASAMYDEGIRLFRNDLENEREFIAVKLAAYNSETPVLNCQIFMKFEEGSHWATTSSANNAVGFDHMSYLFVNPTMDHSRALSISVVWPSGAVTEYDITDVELWGTTILRQPVFATHPGVEPDLPPEIDPLARMDMNVSPNPFNPSASVKYTVPEAGQVNLSVFNLLGQEVASLVSGYREAGVHSVTFDASALPSGLYLARLTTAGQTQLHRMVLTK